MYDRENVKIKVTHISSTAYGQFARKLLDYTLHNITLFIDRPAKNFEIFYDEIS